MRDLKVVGGEGGEGRGGGGGGSKMKIYFAENGEYFKVLYCTEFHSCKYFSS